MPCENYREALTEAAATGSVLSPELRLHVERCADCRAYFDEEIQLFAAIDGELHGKMAADVPVSLLPRVRAGISEQTNRVWRWTSAWTALAVCAAVAIVFLAIRATEHRGGPLQVEGGNVARNVTSNQSAPVKTPEEMVPAVRLPARKQNAPQALETAKAQPTTEEPLVLVPRGQGEIVARLLENLGGGQIKAKELAGDSTTDDPEIPPIAPLSIAPVEIKPLNAEDAKEVRR